MNNTTPKRFPKARRDPELIPVITGLQRQNLAPRGQRAIARLSPFPRSPSLALGHNTNSNMMSKHRPATILMSRCGSNEVNERQSTSQAKRHAALPCSVCFRDMHPATEIPLSTLRCGHAYCTPCISKWISYKRCCPICKKTAIVSDIRPLYL